jgi:hypothetical protein
MVQLRSSLFLLMFAVTVGCQIRMFFPGKMADVACEIAKECSDAIVDTGGWDSGKPMPMYTSLEECIADGRKTIKAETKDCKKFHPVKAQECIDRLTRLKDQCSGDYEGDWRGEADRLLNFEDDCEGVYSKCD